jgi:D-sedoheptulose 7-phosphate isomerase
MWRNEMKDFYESYLKELKKSLDSLIIEDLEEVTLALKEAYDKDRQIFIFGNGGSAATASHFVCDLGKGTVVKGKKRFRAIGLNDNIPLLTAWSNDLTFEECFKEQLINLLQEGDLVIAFSASGNSKNVLKAVEYAKSKGATTIGFSGFKGGELAKITHKPIVVKSDNMERIEDIHLILEHMIKSCLKEIIRTS